MDAPIAALQVPAELPVLLQPPERRSGEEQELGPPGAQLLQVRDRLLAVSRVVAGVDPFLVLGEVPASPALSQLEQFLVALARYGDGGPGWQGGVHRLLDPPHEPLVVDLPAKFLIAAVVARHEIRIGRADR